MLNFFHFYYVCSLDVKAPKPSMIWEHTSSIPDCIYSDLSSQDLQDKVTLLCGKPSQYYFQAFSSLTTVAEESSLIKTYVQTKQEVISNF